MTIYQGLMVVILILTVACLSLLYLWIHARKSLLLPIGAIDSIKTEQLHNDSEKQITGYLSETNFRNILQKLPVPFILYNHEQLSIKYINERFTVAYGYTLSDFGTYEHLWQLLCPNQGYRKRVINRWCEIYNDLVIYHHSLKPSEFYLHCKNGATKRIELDLVKLDNLFIATFNDITDRITTQENLRLAKEKAEQADVMKSAFLANLSHEIRNPLNGIMGFVQLLSRSTDLEKHKFYSQIILQNSNRLLGIFNDVLEISKIESGYLAIEKHLFILSELMHDLFGFFENQIKVLKKDIHLFLITDKEEDLTLETDETRLYQILSNLLGNAIKFTEKGEIRFGYKIYTDFIQFFVKDTGIGIEKDKLKLIFERFYQLEEHTRKVYGGTGLGLSIAKALIEKLGGNIEVNSEPGKGTEFIFRLPFDAKTKLVESNPPSFQNMYDFKGKKILIVEDEFDNYDLIKEALQPLNVEIIHACDGKMALDICREDPNIDIWF